MDGLLTQVGEDRFDLTLRFHGPDSDQPLAQHDLSFSKAEIFTNLHRIVQELAKEAGTELPENLRNEMNFGTDNPDAFLKFIEGYDSLQYLQQSDGQVAREFSPEPAYASLLEAVEMDPDFLGPYETLVQLCRGCAHFRIGSFESAESALNRLTQLVPDDFRAFFGLGEVYQAVGNFARVSDCYEKALQVHEGAKEEGMSPEELANWNQEHAAMHTRLGIAQLSMNMPVNAERNFRQAVELEGDDKPSMDYLADVLQRTNRAHEVPGLWRKELDKNPNSPQLNTKYAVSLVNSGREDEGIQAFERALETVEDNVFIKRYYAPLLANKGEHDRAMDFYEDCIDVAPNDIQLLLEYAQTLQAAGREFEVPKVLKDVLASNPDPNTRAQTMAWLIELEQPKRVQSVEEAQKKVDAGDFEGAVRDLKPLRNWLADYWKMWALLSHALNRMEEHEEAKEAAERLINMFPGCEPAYGELMNALTATGHHEEAYNLMRFAAANIQGSLGVHINLALAAKRAGREDEARDLAKQIREAIGPNPELEPVLAEIER
jgi:tetratricopeptide (TPR) repeat protein